MKEKIWIIGAGHFGKRAFTKLNKQNNYDFTIIDPLRKTLVETEAPHECLIEEDGISWLTANLLSNNKPEWIIPALPLHLGALWIKSTISRKLSQIEVPLSMDALVPNPLRGESKDLYVSHATFRCPDNCSEPDNICTYTGKPRKPDMFSILEDISIDGFDTFVLQSFQLGSGIGGYKPDQLFQMAEAIDKSKKNILICTSCRCHGVISAFN